MNIKGAYDEWSASYDSDHNRTRDLDQTATRETLAQFQFKNILEVGCGTGKNTPFLSLLGDKVFSMDFSTGMLAMAREKVFSPHVHFCVADITRDWPIQAGTVDLVTCNLVLEHVEDLSPVFSYAYRSLIKGGRFLISELHPFRQYQEKKAQFELGDKTIEIDAFVHHISEFFEAAAACRFDLMQFREWWHVDDGYQLPRLASFLFQK